MQHLRLLSAASLVSLVACVGRAVDVASATPDDKLESTAPSNTGQDAGNDSGKVASPVFPDGPGPAPTGKCSFQKDAQGFAPFAVGGIRHTVRLPTSYSESAPTPTALLVVLHGCGDSALNAANWMGTPWELRPNGIKHIVLGVGGRDGACWGNDSNLVTAAIEALSSCVYVDRRRVVLGGYSSGGELGFRLMYERGTQFAGLLVEHSGMDQAFPNKDLTALSKTAPWKFPVAWVAGVNDSVFPIANVRREKDILAAAGHPLKYVETNDAHEGKSDPNWKSTLIPAMANWSTP